MNHNASAPAYAMNLSARTVLKFAQFELDQARAALTREGIEVPLRPKCFDVLRYLVEHPGRLVSKEELIAAIWPGLVVTESSLPQCMVEVRRALGEEASRLITTLPRRGYRFEANVTVSASKSCLVLRRKPPLPKLWSNGAAVLALVALTALVGWSALTRVPTASGASPVNPVAQDNYLQGRYFQDRRGAGDLQRAITYYRRATELDPGFADAWVGLASALYLEANRAGDVSFQSWGPEFKVALDHALEIDPDNAEAHLRMSIFYLEKGDFAAQKAHFNRAVSLGGEQALFLSTAAGVAFYRSELTKAIELQGRAVELEPLNYAGQANLGFYFLNSGNPTLARHHLEIARDLSPDNHEDLAPDLMQTLVLLRDFDAVMHLTMALPDGATRNFGLAVSSAVVGDSTGLDHYIGRLQDDGSADAALRLAEFHAWQNRDDLSREWLEVALGRQSQSTDDCGLRTYIHETLFSPLLNRIAEGFPRSKWQNLGGRPEGEAGKWCLVGAPPSQEWKGPESPPLAPESRGTTSASYFGPFTFFRSLT